MHINEALEGHYNFCIIIARAIMCLSVILTKLIGYRTVMRGSRNFRQGGGGGGSRTKKL